MEFFMMHNCEDYQKFFEKCPVGLYKTQQKDGLFVEINPFGAKLLGYDSPKDVIGKVYSTAHYPKATRAKLVDVLHTNGSVSDFEIEFEQVDGTVLWVSATATNGDEFIIGSLTDISERKRMECEIKSLKISQLSVLKQISQDVRQRCEALDKVI
jgi:PAS domain S-box-containing protein